MPDQNLLSLINSVALVFLAISPAVFIFSATLLGTAIEKAHQEEKAARENDKDKIQKQLDELEVIFESAKKDQNISLITDKIKDLKIDQAYADKKIYEIKKKYNRINFDNTLLFPCIAFLIVLGLGILGSILNSYIPEAASQLLIILKFILLLYGVMKLYLSLKLIQEINANKKESEQHDRLRETIKHALQEYDQEGKEDVEISFVDKTFPLSVTCSAELSIDFKVKLKTGSIITNLYAWFFVQDGFELVDPPESRSWRQSRDYAFPNIRTVKVSLGTLNVGPYKPGTLKIKTPNIPGKYTLRYKLNGDRYSGPTQDLLLFVG